MDHGSEGTFGIPLCSAWYIWLLQINSCMNSSRLQKNKSLPGFPEQETLHHSCHGSLPPPDSSKPVWLHSRAFPQLQDVFDRDTAEPLPSHSSLPGTGGPREALATSALSPCELWSSGRRQGHHVPCLEEVAGGTAPRGQSIPGCSEHRLPCPKGMLPSRDGARGSMPGTGLLSSLVT